MKFTIEFYETSSGRCPIREFLDDLKESDPDDFAAVMAGFTKLQNRHYHKPPLSKHIGDDLFELRHVGKLNSRLLYFFMKGKRILNGPRSPKNPVTLNRWRAGFCILWPRKKRKGTDMGQNISH